MPLASYTPPRKDIPAGSTVISVRGLNLNDVALLMAAHGADLFAAYAAFEKMMDEATIDGQLISRVVIETVIKAPQLAADIIKLGADEPDSGDAALTLPFPVQVAALSTIMNMTFEAGGGLGNFLAALGGIARGLGIEMPESLPASRKASTKPT